MLRHVLWVSGLTFLISCGGGGSSPAPDPAPIPQPNSAPMITSSAATFVSEGTAGSFLNVTANDTDNDNLTYSLTGGADQSLFSISPSGALSFSDIPDFEVPEDANGDNIFEITVSVSDGEAMDSLNLLITLTDGDDFTVRRIINSGLSGGPLFALPRGDGTNRLFIVQKNGVIEILNLNTGQLENSAFLTITSSISQAQEGGLLGMALAPDFATSGIFYVHATDVSGATEIRRYNVSANNPDIADAASEDVILTFPRPSAFHHGGWMGFGPDGYLYILLGDGDVDANAAQDNSNFLGTLLRIDPAGDDFPADPMRDYAIPDGNPFIGAVGLDEIYAYGLRNPFQGSFDSLTGDLYIGDVGENNIEEVSLVPPGVAGQNFGWPILEGTRVNAPGSTDGLTPPVTEYSHGSGPRQGNSIVGGYVYRGPIPELQGRYIFGDFVNNSFWSIDADEVEQGQTIGSDEYEILTDIFDPDLGNFDLFVSFAEDDQQNLYMIDFDGEVFAIEPF